MNTAMISVIAVFLGLAMASTGHAESAIYKQVDDDGRITFSNRSGQGGKKIQSAPNNTRAKAIVSSIAPAHFPKVNVSMQKKRDVKRREILEHELADEKKQLYDTQRYVSLVDNNPEMHQQQERMMRLQYKLQRHERNIASLKRELEKL